MASYRIKIENANQIKRVGEKIKFSTTYTQFNSFHIKEIAWDFGDGTKSTKVNPSHRYLSQGVKNIKCVINRQVIMRLKLRIHAELIVEPEIPGIRLRVINNSSNNDLNVIIFQKNEVADFETSAIAWTVLSNLDINKNKTVIFGSELRMGYKKIDTLSETIVCTPGQQIIANEDFTMGYNGPSNNVNEIEIISNVFTLAAITGRLYRSNRLLMQSNLLDNGSIGYFRTRPTLWIGVVAGINQGDIIGGEILSQVNTELGLLGIASADIVITGGSGDNPYNFTLQNIVFT